MDEQDYMLTTYDNPFDPFSEFTIWFKEDRRLGHDTCGLLAKYANTSSTLSDQINNELTIEAMKEIVKCYPMIYRMVPESQAKPRHPDVNRQD